MIGQFESDPDAVEVGIAKALQLFSVDLDAPGIFSEEPVKDFLSGAFPGTAGPQEAKYLTFLDMEVQPTQGGCLIAWVGEAQALYRNHGISLTRMPF